MNPNREIRQSKSGTLRCGAESKSTGQQQIVMIKNVKSEEVVSVKVVSVYKLKSRPFPGSGEVLITFILSHPAVAPTSTHAQAHDRIV
jgi:hypothetical protein